MGILDDWQRYRAKGGLGQTGGSNPFAPVAAPHPTQMPQPGFIEGAISSVASSIPELFGAPAQPSAEAFRAQHPISGLITEMAGMSMPYLGWARAARAPAIAQRVGKVTGAIVPNAAANPIKAGAVNMLALTLPVEAARLGVGSFVAEDYGELLADVALSTALAGGIGAIGGMFRMGGKAGASREVTDIRDLDAYASDTLRLQALKLGGEEVLANPELGLDATRKLLVNNVLSETQTKLPISNTVQPYIRALDGGTKEDTAAINMLFKPSHGGSKRTEETHGIKRKLLLESDNPNDMRLNRGEQQEIVDALGLQSIDDLAENAMFPRIMEVDSPSAAGRLSKEYLGRDALKKVGDDGWIGREAGDGLYIVVKRLPPKAAPEEAPDLVATAAAGLDEVKPVRAVEEQNADLYRMSQKELEELRKTAPPENTVDEGILAREHVDEVLNAHRPDYDKMDDEALVDLIRTVVIRNREPDWTRQVLLGKAGLRSDLQSDFVKLQKAYAAISKRPAKADLRNRILQSMTDRGWSRPDAEEVLDFRMGKLAEAKVNPSLPAPESIAVSAGKLVDEAVGTARSKAPRRYGPAKVAPGDRFLIAKTNRPGTFFKDQKKLDDVNFAQWSKWRSAFQPTMSDDLFNQSDDQLLSMVSAQDYRIMQTRSKSKAIEHLQVKFAKAVTGDPTATGSATARGMAEGVYDAFAPTMFKQGKHTLYGRLEGTQRARVRVVSENVNKMMFGATKIAGSLWKTIHRRQHDPDSWIAHFMAIPKDERHLVIKAAQTQTPAEKLEELVEGGIVSDITKQSIAAMQRLDQDFLERVVYPGLNSVGEREKFEALKGYIMPIIHLGDFRQIIRDENGKVVWIVSGRNGASTNRQAAIILEEAKMNGRNLVADKADFRHVTSEGLDIQDKAIDDIFEDVARRIGKDEQIDRIVRDAMKKINYRAADSGRPAMSAGTPGMFKMRSGMTAVDDLPSDEEVIRAVEAHYRQLGNYSAMQGWADRWGGELTRFQKVSPTMFEDLMRKRNQYLGIEGKLTNALNKSLQPMLGPILGSKPATKIAAAVNETLYNFNLAWVNPSFALLNALSPIQTVLPHIAYVLNASKGRMENMMQVTVAFDGNGKPVGSAGILDPLKILGQGIRDMRDPSPELRYHLERLSDEGSLTAQLFEEHIGRGARGAGGLKEAFKDGGYVSFIRESATYMARKSEEIARMVSATSAYNLGKHSLGLEGPQLTQFMRRFVENTNYLYGVADRPRIFTGPVGSIFGLFKNWQMHYMGMMANYAGLAWKENVYSPLMWQAASALAIGGIGATPIRHLADGLAAWNGSDKDGYRYMLETWPHQADELWFGLPSFLGVSLQASAATPGTDVRNELASLGNIVAVERAKAIGKATGAVIDRWKATGELQLEDPNLRDGLLAALTPRALHRIVSTTEGDYVRSMTTGYPSVRGVSPADKMLQSFGFNALDIERQRVVANQLFKDQQRHRNTVTNLGATYAQAQLRQDSSGMQRVIDQALLQKIPLSSVMRSSRNFLRRETESDSLSRYDRVSAAEAMELLEQSR